MVKESREGPCSRTSDVGIEGSKGDPLGTSQGQRSKPKNNLGTLSHSSRVDWLNTLLPHLCYRPWDRTRTGNGTPQTVVVGVFSDPYPRTPYSNKIPPFLKTPIIVFNFFLPHLLTEPQSTDPVGSTPPVLRYSEITKEVVHN